MAGGIGNRFWPVSNQHCPKQFSDILHTGKSFIRQTYERIAQIFPNHRIFIVTGEEYEEITRKQIPEIPNENILKEPYVRNTATCIAYAAYKIHIINPEAYMVTIPSDHFITNDLAYLQDLKDGMEFVEKQGGLLTVGITPEPYRNRIRLYSSQIQKFLGKNFRSKDFYRKTECRISQDVL